jgi:hypothetical protein
VLAHTPQCQSESHILLLMLEWKRWWKAAIDHSWTLQRKHRVVHCSQRQHLQQIFLLQVRLAGEAHSFSERACTPHNTRSVSCTRALQCAHACTQQHALLDGCCIHCVIGTTDCAQDTTESYCTEQICHKAPECEGVSCFMGQSMHGTRRWTIAAILLLSERGVHIMEPMIMFTTSFMRAPAPTAPRKKSALPITSNAGLQSL